MTPTKDIKGWDIFGDVHGCFTELKELFNKLDYIEKDDIFYPSEERQAIFLGDITDRGPCSLSCFNLAKRMVEIGVAKWVKGNHDDKLQRYCEGKKVIQNHGLDQTVREFENGEADKAEVSAFLKSLPLYLSLDNGKLICVHAAWRDNLPNAKAGELKSWCLYGPTRGILPNGMPDRIDWVINREVAKNSPWIIYGHQPLSNVRILNKTVGLDTGCVFGNKLSVLRWPEIEVVQVLAQKEYERQQNESW